MSKPRLLFIHRSVGQNLINDSQLYTLVEQAGQPFLLSDFNQNTNTFRAANEEPHTVAWQFPGGDTTPEDYAALFSAERLAAGDPMLKEILAYDSIAIKSCFPNTRITSDAMLERHTQAYKNIIQFFRSQPTKKLIILTSPPLIPTLTLPSFAKRARKLAQWLASTDFGSNVFVFDFFDALAVPEGKFQANTLRREYRRRFPFDSHPNAAAAKATAPKIVQFFTDIARR